MCITIYDKKKIHMQRICWHIEFTHHNTISLVTHSITRPSNLQFSVPGQPSQEDLCTQTGDMLVQGLVLALCMARWGRQYWAHSPGNQEPSAAQSTRLRYDANTYCLNTPCCTLGTVIPVSGTWADMRLGCIVGVCACVYCICVQYLQTA